MTPTLHQLARGLRKRKRRRCYVPALLGCPQKRGLVYKVAIMSPRKPNSAKRRFAKIRILGGKEYKRKVFAHIPGIGDHGLAEYAIVLLSGGSRRDSPGINYSLIRGSLDFGLLERHGRRNRRSKFGKPRPRYDYEAIKQV